MKDLGDRLDSGLVLFNDRTEIFEKLVSWGGSERSLEPSGRPFLVEINGQKFVYFVWPGPKPVVRVKFDWKAIQDLKQYEGLVCPQQGQCEWRAATEPSKPAPLLDIETGKPQNLRMVSANWNDYRKRWVGILEQMPGEVWYAEADTPAGPWLYARRIIKHENYNFYWAGHLPWFDRQGGKRIFIMGTYTNSFTNNPFKTPRYNYNQIMYGLSLDDPRLALPAPVYRLKDGSLAMRDEVEKRKAWNEIAEIPFYRLPPGSAKSGKTWPNSSKTLPLDRAARANVTQ
jgi:hypothetical protein